MRMMIKWCMQREREREMDGGKMVCTSFVIYDDVYEFVIIIADKRKLRDDSRPNKIPHE
jgi:hypothetical protein